MKVKVSSELNDIYKRQHKNFDYAISSALNYVDPDSFIDCFEIVNGFEIKGVPIEIEIGDDLVNRLKNDFCIKTVDDKTVVILLWLGAILPEV